MSLKNTPQPVSAETLRTVAVLAVIAGCFVLALAVGGWLIEYAIETVLVVVLSLSNARTIPVAEIRVYPRGTIAALAWVAYLLLLAGVGSYAYSQVRGRERAG